MGFHVCEYCKDEISSGDVTLDYGNGNVFQVPDMILHYIADHQYLPPEEFINIVRGCDLVNGRRVLTKSTATKVGHLSGPFPTATKVGYLSGPFPTGLTPANFFESLWFDIRKATKMHQRRQTRGM